MKIKHEGNNFEFKDEKEIRHELFIVSQEIEKLNTLSLVRYKKKLKYLLKKVRKNT